MGGSASTRLNVTYDNLSDTELAERVTDSVIVGLGEYSTEQLRRVIAERQRVNPDCWMVKMLGDYCEVWR